MTMNKFRKYISVIGFIVLVIVGITGVIYLSTKPLEYRYSGDMVYSSTAELNNTLNSLILDNIKEIKIKNISNRLPDNLKDHIMIRIEIQTKTGSPEITIIPHEKLSIFSSTAVCISLVFVSYLIFFVIVWPC